MYLSKGEGAKFWLAVLPNLKNRRMQDMLIACIGELTEFFEVIAAIVPKMEVQTYVSSTKNPKQPTLHY